MPYKIPGGFYTIKNIENSQKKCQTNLEAFSLFFGIGGLNQDPFFIVI